MTEMAISPLRRRMIEDMTVRNFVEKTQNDYIRHVKNLTAFLGRLARYGHGRGPAPLPAAPDRGRRPPADHQRCGFGPAVLLLRHGGPARCHQTADVRRRAAQDPRRVEPRGGGVRPGGGAWAEVQGCPERRLWRGPARVRGRGAQGQRRRFQAHAAQDRAGQGAHGIALRCSRRSCSSSCATGGGSPGLRSGSSPDKTRSTLSPRVSSTGPSMPPRARPRSPSGSRRTRCATASRPTCWSRTSISA